MLPETVHRGGRGGCGSRGLRRGLGRRMARARRFYEMQPTTGGEVSDEAVVIGERMREKCAK